MLMSVCRSVKYAKSDQDWGLQGHDVVLDINEHSKPSKQHYRPKLYKIQEQLFRHKGYKILTTQYEI